MWLKRFAAFDPVARPGIALPPREVPVEGAALQVIEAPHALGESAGAACFHASGVENR
jgi:hypothetical protein